MLTPVAIVTDDAVTVVWPRSSDATGTTVAEQADNATAATVDQAQPAGAEEAHEEVPEKDLNPIFPELKEVIWGFGSFAVLAVAMRYFLYPRLRVGMDARYRQVQGDRDQAKQLTEDARSAVADYDTKRAELRARARQRTDAARATLESERTARLEEVNARIAECRAAAKAQAESARAEAMQDVEVAVRTVATRVGELAIGQQVSSDVVERAVAETLSAGATR